MAQKMKLSIHLLTKNLKTYTKRTKSIIMINFFHLLNNFSSSSLQNVFTLQRKNTECCFNLILWKHK